MTDMLKLPDTPADVEADPDAKPKLVLTNQQLVDFGENNVEGGSTIQIDYIGAVIWRVIVDGKLLQPTPGQAQLVHERDGDPESPVVLRYSTADGADQTAGLAGGKTRRFDITES